MDLAAIKRTIYPAVNLTLGKGGLQIKRETTPPWLRIKHTKKAYEAKPVQGEPTADTMPDLSDPLNTDQITSFFRRAETLPMQERVRSMESPDYLSEPIKLKTHKGTYITYLLAVSKKRDSVPWLAPFPDLAPKYSLI